MRVELFFMVNRVIGYGILFGWDFDNGSIYISDGIIVYGKRESILVCGRCWFFLEMDSIMLDFLFLLYWLVVYMVSRG